MAEENTVEATQDEGQVQETTQEVSQGAQEQPDNSEVEMTEEDYKKALQKANAEAAKYRTQRNEFRADAEKFRELKESEMTELEKATKAREEAEAKAAAAERELKLVSVLREYGISDENVDLLGDDPAKFEERATKLQALQKQAARRSGPPSDYPVEDLKPGASSPKEPLDAAYPAEWRPVGQFTEK